MYCPYIKRYTERFEKHNIEYEVLFWNRAGLALNMPKNYKYFDLKSDESSKAEKKLIDFFRFRHWLKKSIRQSKPDKLIVLSTLSGMVMPDILKRYKNRYIFDIRDYSYENIRLFYNIEKKIIENSTFTAISSKGFEAFLPQHSYVIAHNFNRNDMKDQREFQKSGKPIKLVWNGTVRFFEFQKNYIDALKNDERFLMVYHGNGTDLEKYKNYCKENNIRNVIFTGSYENSEKARLLADAGILNNCYGGKSGDELRFAVSNRFYDGLIYGIPQLVESGGYKASLVKQINVGTDMKADKNFADKLYDYYMSIDEKQFNSHGKEALEEIIKEDDIYINEIDKFIREGQRD